MTGNGSLHAGSPHLGCRSAMPLKNEFPGRRRPEMCRTQASLTAQPIIVCIQKLGTSLSRIVRSV
jgi:hypothetical protein